MQSAPSVPSRPFFRVLKHRALTASSTYFGTTGKKPRSYLVSYCAPCRAAPPLRLGEPRRSLRFRSSCRSTEGRYFREHRGQAQWLAETP